MAHIFYPPNCDNCGLPLVITKDEEHSTGFHARCFRCEKESHGRTEAEAVKTFHSKQKQGINLKIGKEE